MNNYLMFRKTQESQIVGPQIRSNFNNLNFCKKNVLKIITSVLNNLFHNEVSMLYNIKNT